MIKVSKAALEKFGRKLSQHVAKQQKEGELQMKTAINIIYRTATAKREMIGKKGKRVSNPAAAFGVAVAEHEGGRLKASIKKEVLTKGFHITGRVYVDEKDVPYAKRIEFGFIGKDSLGRMYHQAPRPFIRPAWDLNKVAVDKILKGEMK
ncbi:MAG: HK97-gp10 family putative phage morphogenesis protein [Nitrospiria bacterium]